MIDDGSTDNSHKILTSLSDEYNFIYQHQENKGLIETLNDVLNIVQGNYFCMLGSDDYFVKNKIELQVSFFINHQEFALCYGNITFIDSNGNIRKNGKTKHFKSGYIFNDLLYKCFIPLPSVMVKTDIIKEYGFDERFFLEDYPLWLKISQKYKMGYIKQPLTFYRQHGNNVSKNMVQMIKEVETILLDYKDNQNYKKVMSKWYLRWFSDLSKTSNLEYTYEYMQKAMATSFFKIRFIKGLLKYVLKSRANKA